MEFLNDPFQTDSDRPDYAKMRGPVNWRELTVTKLSSRNGSEGGACPTFLRNELCGEAEETFPENIVHPVINHSVPNTKVNAAAASVETAQKEGIKAQPDEPIEDEGNVFTANSESEGSDEENEGQADVGMLVHAFRILFAAALRLIKAAKIGINLGVFKFEKPLDALWGDN